MSTGLELIPLAIAIGVAVADKRKRRADLQATGEWDVYAMATRMRDGAILARALEQLGVPSTERGAEIHVTVDDVKITFARPDDVDAYDAHFAAAVTEQRARELVLQIDKAYVVEVQRGVREKVLVRAAEHGLVVASETREEDGSMLLTLEVVG
jgi:hypothetical protein